MHAGLAIGRSHRLTNQFSNHISHHAVHMPSYRMAGVAKYGEPLGLSDSADLKVDMIVVGSSAVSRNGARLGKGEVRASLTHRTRRLELPSGWCSVGTDIHTCTPLQSPAGHFDMPPCFG